MMSNRLCRFALTSLVILAPSLLSHAELKSKSGKIIVLAPEDLPQQARVSGNGLFLHASENGNSYLYVEQQNGAVLTIFDVSDPAHVKVKATQQLAGGPFEFVRPEGEHAELIRFRDSARVAVLDVSKPDKPVMHDAPALKPSQNTLVTDKADSTEANVPLNSAPIIPKNYDVVDTSSPDKPELVSTVQFVEHQAVKEDTGTTFLLARNGLTVIRRPDVEEVYSAQQEELKGN